jgi:hypothetical protein
MLQNITVDISVAELQQLVKDAVEKQFGMVASNITFNMPTQAVGYGLAERDEKVFTGVTVKLTPRDTQR